jgi:hypothetical protein
MSSSWLNNYFKNQVSSWCWKINESSELWTWVRNKAMNVLDLNVIPIFIYNSNMWGASIEWMYYVDFWHNTGKVAIKLDWDEIIEQDEKSAA